MPITAATRRGEDRRPAERLHVAFDLGSRSWRMVTTRGPAWRARERTLAAGDWAGCAGELDRAKAHFGLPAGAAVVSCYEAGRDGFWVHRALGARGITNHVVDPASVAVARRARRAKTDRLDAEQLLGLLLRHVGGGAAGLAGGAGAVGGG